MKILVVEDDKILNKALSNGLKKSGYAVDSVFDGEEALYNLEIYQYDAVILDLNLPKIDGIEILRHIRKNDAELRVMILSARGEVDDKVIGLDSGANDYMSKPFHFKELDARLRALLARKFIQTDAVLLHGEIELNTAMKQIFAAGVKLELTKKEYGILEYLMRHKARAVSAEELLEHVWDSDADLYPSSVKVHINFIKKKLAACLGEKEIIKNTRGIGYYLSEETDENI